MNHSRSATRSPLIRRLVIAGALVVLGIAMVLNTKFLTPDEVDALTPDEFDSQATAEELFAEAQTELVGDAEELGPIVVALAEDSEAAAEEFDAYTPSEGITAYPVTVTGTVEEATDENLVLTAEGVEEDRPVVIPLGNALDGNLIRDLMGFGFGDAPGQTDYQQVGTHLSALLQSNAQDAVGEDPAALEGEEITVQGILRDVSTGEDSGEAPLVVQPLELEAGS